MLNGAARYKLQELGYLFGRKCEKDAVGRHALQAYALFPGKSIEHIFLITDSGLPMSMTKPNSRSWIVPRAKFARLMPSEFSLDSEAFPSMRFLVRICQDCDAADALSHIVSTKLNFL